MNEKEKDIRIMRYANNMLQPGDHEIDDTLDGDEIAGPMSEDDYASEWAPHLEAPERLTKMALAEADPSDPHRWTCGVDPEHDLKPGDTMVSELVWLALEIGAEDPWSSCPWAGVQVTYRYNGGDVDNRDNYTLVGTEII